MSDRAWNYPFDLPAGDFRTGRALVRPGFCPVLTGVDGRYTGGLRVFPGMRPDTGFNFGPITGTPVFRYIEVQKGTTAHVLRGFILATGTSTQFRYYDSELDRVVVKTLTEPPAGTVQDVAARGRFIYVMCGSSGCFTYVVDNAGAFTAYTFGYTSLPSLSVVSPIPHVGQKNLNFGGKIEVPSEPFWDEVLGSYRIRFDVTWMVGVRLGNAIRNVWTPLVLATVTGYVGTWAAGTDLDKVPDDWVGMITGTITLPASGHSYDTVEIYRTVGNGGTLYREFALTVDGGLGTGTRTFALGAGGFVPADWVGTSSDAYLTIGAPVYDPEWDDPGAPRPTGDRIAMMGAVTVMRPDPSAGSEELGETWWSRTDKKAAETFPADNVYRPPTLSDRPLTYISAGSVVYGLAPSRVYRFARSGTAMAVHEVAVGYGIVGRYAACAVGTDVAYVSHAGLVMLSGATGQVTTVGALDRLIQTDWAKQRSDLVLVYDSELMALFILNPAIEEAVVLWGSTNTVSRLKDMRFIAAVSSPVPSTGGPKRAHFLTPEGRVFRVNADRSYWVNNMMGITGAPRNGTFTAASTGTTLTCSTATWPVGNEMAGAYVYILSGVSAGQKRVITGSTATTLKVSSPVTVAAGDRFAISPIPFEVVGWPLGADDDPRVPRVLNLRRTLKSVGANVVLHGGDTNPATNPNLKLTVQGFKRMDTTPLVTQEIAMVEEPAACIGKALVSDYIVYPGIKVLSSNVDFTLVSMTAWGNLGQGGDERA